MMSQETRNDFEKDLRAWRVTRPDYKKMVAGVRAELPIGELNELADGAGFTLTEISELRTSRARAKPLEKLAGTLGEKRRAFDAADKVYRLADAKLAGAATRLAQEEAEDALDLAAKQRQQAELAMGEADVANQFFTAAKEAGLV